MNMMILVTPEMEPIPKELVCKIFAENHKIVNEDGEVLATGKECYLTGEQQTFVDWLKPFDGVYLATGQDEWQVVHIKDDV